MGSGGRGIEVGVRDKDVGLGGGGMRSGRGSRREKYTTAIRTSHKGMVGPDLLFTRIRFTQSFRKLI